MRAAELKQEVGQGRSEAGQICIGPNIYVINGSCRIEDAPAPDQPWTSTHDFDAMLRFKGKNYLIDPEDVAMLTKLIAQPGPQSVPLKMRVLRSDDVVCHFVCDDFKWRTSMSPSFSFLEGNRVHHAGEYDWAQVEAELLHHKLLIESVIQSDVIALSVLSPHYDSEGNLVDFKWVLANKLLKALARGKNVVGVRYSKVFPSSRNNGVMDILKDVHRSGQRQVNEVYYQDSNVRGWMRQVYVKSRDYIILTAEDITLSKKAADELRQSQERLILANETIAHRAAAEYRTLFSSIDQGFAILQPDELNGLLDYIILQVNPAFEKLIQIPNAVGEHVGSLFPENRSEFISIVRRVFETLHANRGTISIAHGERYLEIYAFPAVGGRGQRIAILVSDVTDRKQSEKKLKELNSRLKEIDNEKTRFFSNVSHEFKTPLALMLGPLNDLLREEQASFTLAQRNRLELAVRNAKRLQKLVNTLLDFAKIEGGRLDTFFQPTDLSQMTTDVTSTFRSIIEEAGIKFVVKIERLDQLVYVNREMWEKIVLNLLSNAFKFTHAGKIEVTLRQLQSKVQLSVKDSGIGISKPNLARIFERFIRIEGSKGRTYEGSGIGLALVKEMVLAHHGKITVKSKEGKGSSFIVSVPKGKSHLPTDHIFETSKVVGDHNAAVSYVEEARGWLPEADDRRRVRKPQSEDRLGITTATVLVVDDNADMRNYLKEILGTQYHVVAVENGKKALSILLKGMLPDLVITDVMMPEMDGLDLLSAIKNNENFADIPVILLTAKSAEEAVIEGIVAGADDYLSKPFTSMLVMSLVQSRLSASIARRSAIRKLREHTEELKGKCDETKQSLSDVTTAFEDTSQKLTAAEAELSNYTFIASHDLKEPLRKIMLLSSLLDESERENFSPAGRNTLNRMLKSVERLNGLINDVVAFTSLSLSSSMERGPIDLRSCAEKVIEKFASALRETGGRIEFGELHHIMGVGFQIELLLRHLVSNAIKFHRPGASPVVKIYGEHLNHIVGSQPQVRPFYQLTISDNGIGFDADLNEKIFNMFQRLYSKEQFDGRGIGLAICKKVMENHQGQIMAKSKEGMGSSFICLFPLDTSG